MLLKYTHRIQNREGIYEVKFLETDIFQGQFRSLLPFIPLHCMLPRSGTSVRFQHYDVRIFFLLIFNKDLGWFREGPAQATSYGGNPHLLSLSLLWIMNTPVFSGDIGFWGVEVSSLKPRSGSFRYTPPSSLRHDLITSFYFPKHLP